MKPRKLTAAEVTFTVELEPEDMPVRGYFMSGDPDYEQADRELEDSIIERADRGEVEAWCCIVVKATWDGFTGTDTLGGCSFVDGIHEPIRSQIESCVDENDMREQALDDLNQAIAARYASLQPLLDCDPGDDSPDSEATQRADYMLDQAKDDR